MNRLHSMLSLLCACFIVSKSRKARESHLLEKMTAYPPLSQILSQEVVLATWDIRSKKRENDSSTYFFSLLFQYQAGGDKIFCMAVYSPVLNRIPRLASNERSQGKSFFQT